MAAAQAIAVKPVRFEYNASAQRKGLTDVKAQIYVSGVAKAVGSNALAMTELDPTNAPGEYTVIVSSAQLTSWGVVAGAENTVIAYLNSASWPGAIPVKQVAQVATADDIIGYLGSPRNASVSQDILDLYNRVGAPAAASVSADILNLASQQATILSQVQALANATDTGGAGVVALQALTYSNKSFTLSDPLTVTDATGNNVTPTSIVVTMQNASGQERGNYITGATQPGGTGAYQLTPTATSTGVYQIPVVIPPGAPEEQLVLKAVYVVNGKTKTLFSVINVVTDWSAEGFSTQSSVDAIASNVASVLSAIQNTTYGLSALQAQLTSVGSSASSASTNAANAYTQSQQNATAIAGVSATLGQVEGTGFDTTKHSLVQLAALIAQIPLSSARGV